MNNQLQTVNGSPSWSQIFWEIKGAWHLYTGPHYRPPKLKRPNAQHSLSESSLILFVGGLFSFPHIYKALAAHLERTVGLPVKFPKIGTALLDSNRLPLATSLHLLRKEIRATMQAGKRIEALIGHSLGGIQAAVMLPEFPEINHVFLLGTPIWGMPHWYLLRQAASYFLKINIDRPPIHLLKLRDSLPRVAHRLVTVSSESDTIAPPAYCYISGAQNIVLNHGTARAWKRRHQKTAHADCVNHPAIEEIVASRLFTLEPKNTF